MVENIKYCYLQYQLAYQNQANIQHLLAIATGAVVNKDVAKNTIVGGVPASFIKHIEVKTAKDKKGYALK